MNDWLEKCISITGKEETRLESCEWLSIHIYGAASELQKVLGILPEVTEELRKHHGLRQYFFVRFNDPLLHIRVRMLVPAQEIDSAYIQLRGGMYQLYPDARLRMEQVSYVREIRRYGGGEGLLLAEDHFDISTQAVLRILKDQPAQSVCLAAAVLLQLGLMRALSSIGTDPAAFCQGYARRLCQTLDIRELPDALISTRNYSRRIIIGYAETIRSAAPGSVWEWYRERTTDILTAIEGIVKHSSNLLTDMTIVHPANPDLYAIVASLHHMNNNRLGLFLPQEYQVNRVAILAWQELAS